METIDLRNTSELFQYVFLPSKAILFTFFRPIGFFVGFIGNIVFASGQLYVHLVYTHLHYVILATLSVTDISTLTGLLIDFYPNFFSHPVRYGKLDTLNIFFIVWSLGLDTCHLCFM